MLEAAVAAVGLLPPPKRAADAGLIGVSIPAPLMLGLVCKLWKLPKFRRCKPLVCKLLV